MIVSLEGGCRVSDMRDGESVQCGTVSIWKQVGRHAGSQAISLRIMEFMPGTSPFIRNGDCDDILFMIAPAELLGNEVGAVVDFQLDSGFYSLETNTGIYIQPNEAFRITNPGPTPVFLISSQCPDPNAQPQFLDSINSDSGMSDHPPLVRLADQPAQPTADRWYRVLVDDRVGSAQVTQFVGSIPPGRAPDHFHQYEEVLFILRGEGKMWAGKSSTPILPGSCIYLPKGQVHCVENTGAGELRLLGIFYPAGSPSVRYDV